MQTRKLDVETLGLRMPDGTLCAFTGVGCYPLVYLGEHDSVLCPKCAHENEAALTACDVHWEGEPLTCDECGADIESAYGV